ncbi:Hsp20/alpha crystallin family protein [Schlesneria paludicola]|uniref:Hsp20/alpha crystallin family protein n=1 Tax=Schlesneria paludicola TaxID=360056 RepID=UPI00029A23FA|nr:Hsp20/alpha crystallin family protein [Schlesneria paludicola]
MFVRTRRFNLPTTDALTTVQREMENLFGRVLHDATENSSNYGWRAPIAMWEDADKVYLELDVPGVAKDTVDLTVHDGVLRITGERKTPEGDRTYWANERNYGTFGRTVALPKDVDADNIDAHLTDGVLQIVLSKRPEAQPKKIALKD